MAIPNRCAITVLQNNSTDLNPRHQNSRRPEQRGSKPQPKEEQTREGSLWPQIQDEAVIPRQNQALLEDLEAISGQRQVAAAVEGHGFLEWRWTGTVPWSHRGGGRELYYASCRTTECSFFLVL